MTHPDSKGKPMQNAMLVGRCLTGFEGDRGTLVHVITGEDGSLTASALCGRKPARLSNGWRVVTAGATCKRCLKRLKAWPEVLRPA